MSVDAVALAAPVVGAETDADEPPRIRALTLARRGRMREAAQVCRIILAEDPDGRRWLADAIVAAMEESDLSYAGALAAILTGIERGSEWHPNWTRGRTQPPVADARLSLGKLRHDLQQFEHLLRLGVCEAPLDEIISAYRVAIQTWSCIDANVRAPLTAQDQHTVARAFARLVHVADAPRVAQALSASWDRRRAEHLYLERSPSVVVIDDFLTAEALQSLLQFCQQSTIWTGNRYANDRLGALFFTGFNAPLILQIAEEIRDAFPILIGEHHPLRQLWAFKNTAFLPPDSTIHADFAAINVNFWITPGSANLDSDSGGMIVYDLEAPLSWAFRQYNERPDLIHELITRHRPSVIRIPYRQNRAIIFNSDLFHATEAVCFQPDYLGCRINVTMLYGDRGMDEYHAEPQQPMDEAIAPIAWRSAAFLHRKR